MANRLPEKEVRELLSAEVNTGATQKEFERHYRELNSPCELEVLHAVFDEYIGQRSWSLKSDYIEAARDLQITQHCCTLDYGCGYGGPTLFLAQLTGCRAIGFDINEAAVETATARAVELGCTERVRFATSLEEARRLAGDKFDSILMNDVICHLPDRRSGLVDCFRALRSGGRILITDPLVETGPLTDEERRLRSANVYFCFAAPQLTPELLSAIGFQILRIDNSTQRLVQLSHRYLEEHEKRRPQLSQEMGAEPFAILQQRLRVVHDTANQGRLSRFTYLAEKP